MRPLLPAIFLGALALTACAQFRAPAGDGDGQQLLNQARGSEENRKLHTDLIREMIDQDRLYAALAHLQAQQNRFGDTPELRLLRAEILRKLGRSDEAEQEYKGLLDTEYKGYAQHGLGLIYAKRDLALGTRYLERAAESRPTDARIRNDLGYALMKQGELDRARIQLATAFQLDDHSKLNRNNYIVLLLIEGNERAARRVASENGIGEKTMTDLRRQAQELQKLAAANRVSGSAVQQSPPAVTVGGGGG